MPLHGRASPNQLPKPQGLAFNRHVVYRMMTPANLLRIKSWGRLQCLLPLLLSNSHHWWFRSQCSSSSAPLFTSPFIMFADDVEEKQQLTPSANWNFWSVDKWIWDRQTGRRRAQLWTSPCHLTPTLRLGCKNLSLGVPFRVLKVAGLFLWSLLFSVWHQKFGAICIIEFIPLFPVSNFMFSSLSF